MPVIFISYRRTDSQDVTGRIYDRLVSKHSPKQVFKDVDNIPLGVTFPMHIKQMLMKANVVLVVIGPSWVSATDEAGRRRLEDPNDFVRLEVETALRSNIPVIPVLVSNARMPHANELPASLKSLTSRNGMAVRPDPDFNNDIQRLFSGIEHLEKLLRPPSGKPALGKNNAAPITVVPIEEKIVITLAPVQPATVRAKAVERGTRRNPPKPAARQAAPKPIYPSRLGLNLLVTLLLVAMFALFSAISFFDVDLATMLGVSKAKGLQLKKEQVVVRPDPSKKANAGKPPVDQPLTVRVFSRLGPGQVLESTNITVGSAIKTIDLSEKGKTQSYVDFHLKGPGTYRYALSTKLTWNTGAVNDGSGEGQITVAEDATYNLVMDNITKTSFSVMLARLSDKLIGNLP